MSRMRFPWKFFFFLILATLGGIVAYDSYKAGGFKKSHTAKYLDDAGVLVHLDHVYHRIKVYSAKAWVWLQENVPYYYAKTCEFAGPYLALFWEKMYAFGIWFGEATADQRAWLNRKVPELLAWVESKVPWLYDTTSHYLTILWEYTVYISLWLWKHIVHYSHIVWHWLIENVLKGALSPENIQKTVSSCLTAIQSFIVQAAKHLLQLINESMTESDLTTTAPPSQQGAPPVKVN